MKRSEINNIQVYLPYQMGKSDLYSMSLLFQEMADHPTLSSEDIFEIGYNKLTGECYMALESKIDLISSFGNPVEYKVTDEVDGTEHTLDTYKEAEEKSKELHKINIQSFN
jgi:hypothetical protein|tara:strand:- start:1584 stop:1916 length:333 start_codon:yes stop_codon:yes gene_type:complete